MNEIVKKSMLGKVWVAADSQMENSNTGVLDEDLIKRILKSRGIVGEENIQKFLNPSIKEYMPDPDVLDGMKQAVSVIVDFVERGKKIAIYGDYDVDGITSTAVFVKFLKEIGADVIWYLPTREAEGYGLNNAAIDSLAAQGANLIITVDCGISAIDEIKYAKSLGVSVVVTDHHSPDSKIPDADAIVNPKLETDNSGLDYLAGVGVAFLVVVALNREIKERAIKSGEKTPEINLINYMDFVALGTICDTMDLIELNRAFVATGLKVLNLKQNMGLRVLAEIAGIKKIDVYAVGFVIGPRLNAAGRLDSAGPALELLLTDNILIAHDLAKKLHDMNKERIDIQNAIMLSASDIAKAQHKTNVNSLFLCGDNWHGGVMGIIAGRLKDKYNLPTCVGVNLDGVINGSGRSIPGVDLGKIIHEALAAGILSEGGGHAAAAGFTLNVEKKAEFCNFLEESVTKQLGGEPPIIEILVDAKLDAGGASMKLVERLSAIEPFGQGNPEPVLVLTGASLRFASSMGSGAHLRGTVSTSSGALLNFVGFNMAATTIGNFLLDDSNTNTNITVLGKLKENTYNGRTTVQFVLEDMTL